MITAGVHSDSAGTIIAVLDTETDVLRITRELTNADGVQVMAAIGTVDPIDGIRIMQTKPATVKRLACGHGGAGGEQMLVAAVKRWYTPSTREEATACWLAAVAAGEY